MNSDQYKEHIVQLLADIKELKQDNIIMENKIQEIRIYYITNKDKLCDKNNWTPAEPITNKTNVIHGAFKSYLRDLSNLIGNENTTIKDNVRKLESFIRNIYYKGLFDDENLTKNLKKMFNFVEDELITRILINNKKLKYYENFMKLYPVSKSKSDNDNDKKLKYYENFMKLYLVSMSKSESESVSESESESESVSESESESKHKKPEIKNIMDIYPKRNHTLSVIILIMIMIMFHIMTAITVVFIINHNYKTAKTEQCVKLPLKNTQLIDTPYISHNKKYLI